MGTSVKSYLAFLVVVVLLETCASEANAALRVQNDLSSTIRQFVQDVYHADLAHWFVLEVLLLRAGRRRA
jgi:hypothetical protein